MSSFFLQLQDVSFKGVDCEYQYEIGGILRRQLKRLRFGYCRNIALSGFVGYTRLEELKFDSQCDLSSSKPLAKNGTLLLPQLKILTIKTCRIALPLSRLFHLAANAIKLVLTFRW